jgi:hypothetical protein
MFCAAARCVSLTADDDVQFNVVKNLSRFNRTPHLDTLCLGFFSSKIITATDFVNDEYFYSID